MPRRVPFIGTSPYEKVSSLYNNNNNNSNRISTSINESKNNKSLDNNLNKSNRARTRTRTRRKKTNGNANQYILDGVMEQEDAHTIVDDRSITSGWSDQILLSYMDKNRTTPKKNQNEESYMRKHNDKSCFKSSRKQSRTISSSNKVKMIRFRRPVPLASDSLDIIQAQQWSSVSSVTTSAGIPPSIPTCSTEIKQQHHGDNRGNTSKLYHASICEGDEFESDNFVPSVFHSNSVTRNTSKNGSSVGKLSDMTDPALWTHQLHTLAHKDNPSFEQKAAKQSQPPHTTNDVLRTPRRMRTPQLPPALSPLTQSSTSISSCDHHNRRHNSRRCERLQRIQKKNKQNTPSKDKTQQFIGNSMPFMSPTSCSYITTPTTSTSMNTSPSYHASALELSSISDVSNSNQISKTSSKLSPVNNHHQTNNSKLNHPTSTNRNTSTISSPNTKSPNKLKKSMTANNNNNSTISQYTESTTCSYSSSSEESSYPHIPICDITTSSNITQEYILLSVASIVIQTFYRGFITRKYYYTKRQAVIRIQSTFRGWMVRDNIYVDSYCAIQIQRIIRGFLSRVSYGYTFYCITVIQSFLRSKLLLTRNTHALSLQQVQLRNRACILIQTNWRSYIVQLNYEWKIMLTIICQASIRRYLARLNYLTTRYQVILIQTYIRRYMARKLFLALRSLNQNEKKTICDAKKKKKVVRYTTTTLGSNPNNKVRIRLQQRKLLHHHHCYQK